MTTIDASQSGTFSIGGVFTVNRLGFGAMRVTGSGIWGPPADHAKAIATLKRVPELGINFIDTADSYGPNVSEELLREALNPFEGLHVATKGGLTRSGPNQWSQKGNPDYLIGQAHGSLNRLGVETIDLWQLHRIDSKVPRDEQFAAIRQLLDDGVVRTAGLSEVSVEEIEAASKYFPVATVQNRYNLADRASEDVLAYCEAHSIGFMPWAPLASGNLDRLGRLVGRIAAAHDATAGQVALAWLLQHSPVMLPIPGTGSVAHLEENTAAAGLILTAAEMEELTAAR